MKNIARMAAFALLLAGAFSVASTPTPATAVPKKAVLAASMTGDGGEPIPLCDPVNPQPGCKILK